MPTLLLPAPPEARNPWAKGYDCYAKALGRRGVARAYLSHHAAEQAKLARVLEKFFGVMAAAIKPNIAQALAHVGKSFWMTVGAVTVRPKDTKAAGQRPISSLIDHAFDSRAWTERLK